MWKLCRPEDIHYTHTRTNYAVIIFGGMLPRIDSIKAMRLKLGITQKKLAAMSGISASMINQIESKRSQPSYETARRIFDSLATLEGSSSPRRVGELCCKNVVTLPPENTLHDAIRKMRQYSISQIPVFRDDRPVGLITEDDIIQHLDAVGEAELKKSQLSETMGPTPPTVDYDTPALVLVPLIRFTKCILVTKHSAVVGIVTASDTLKLME